MSWSEDMGYDAYDDSDIVEERERQWENGKHTTKNGDILKISEMTNEHLRRTIDYFDGYDTKPLLEELRKR